LSRFTRLRNTFAVIDDVGVLAFAGASLFVGGVAVVTAETAWVGVTLAGGSGGGYGVYGVGTFDFLLVGVDLSSKPLLDSRSTKVPDGLSDLNVRLDEDVESRDTDAGVNVTEDNMANLEVQIEADANVSSGFFDEMLVQRRAQH